MTLKPRIVLAISVCLIGVGITVWAATSNFLVANASIAHSSLFDGPAAMTVRELTLAPGETTPWHRHPGAVLVAVKSGTLTREVGCGGGATYSGGQAFEEFGGDVHRAINPGSEPLVVYDVFIIPEGQPSTIFTPNNEQLCGPPASAVSCRSGGWSNFTFPRLFDSQGDCEQYVITGK
jgi:quercetin dioxygenase-like cupin family protein